MSQSDTEVTYFDGPLSGTTVVLRSEPRRRVAQPDGHYALSKGEPKDGRRTATYTWHSDVSSTREQPTADSAPEGAQEAPAAQESDEGSGGATEAFSAQDGPSLPRRRTAGSRRT